MEDPSEMQKGGDFGVGKDVQWSPDPGGTIAPPFSDQVLENVLENVLCFLTSRRDRNAASLVCKAWYRIDSQTRQDVFIGNCYAVSPSRLINRFHGVRSLVLKGKPRFADFNLVPMEWGARFSPWVTAMAPVYPWLEQICLKRMTVSDDDLYVIVCSFPLFRSLSLICCDGFSTAGLTMIVENSMYLRSLDLIENDVDDDDEDLALDWVSRFPPGNTCLESLVFDCVGCPVNFESLLALVARSPFLRRLRVNEFIPVGQLCQLMARAPQLTHLGTGSFSSLEEEGDFVGALETAFQSSKSLSCLSGFRDFAPEYLHTIYPVCSRLTSLNVSYARITPEQLQPIITSCHNLETFWVLDTVRDEGLQMVGAACKKLKELRVFPLDSTEQSEGSVSDVGLVAVSEGCRKLESILYFCQRMTNAAVKTMSENCPELVVFRLCIMGRHRPDHVTGEPMDEGFGAIVKNCKKLTRLAVSGLLTDTAFAYIGKYGSLVRTLSVAFAGNSDLGLQHLLQGCPNLQKLEIRDSPFGDAGLLSGIHHFYNMRFLWMSSCNISLNACKEVARELPRMVVEVIKDMRDEDENDAVDKLYMYRSLVGPRNDAPSYVNIL